MRAKNYILLFICFLSYNLIQAQDKKESSEEGKRPKFSIIGSGGIGYGIVENDNEPNYNLNNNSAEVLLNYKFSSVFGVATGIGWNEMTGNGFNSLGNFYHERSTIKIPLLLTMNSKISDQISVITNFGLYGQTITKDEYRFLNNTRKDIYEGWNFGTQFTFGFAFKLSDRFSTGINYTAQTDFSKFESNNNLGLNDQQRVKGLNAIGIMFMFDL